MSVITNVRTIVITSFSLKVFMPVQRKTAVFQIRIEPELLARFKVACEDAGFTVADALRSYMLRRADIHDEHHQGAPQPQSQPVVKDERLRAYEAKKEARRQVRARK